jgi:hypothetical protein
MGTHWGEPEKFLLKKKSLQRALVERERERANKNLLNFVLGAKESKQKRV